MRHIIAIMIAALCLFHPLHGFTQVKEIVSEGTYNMGDGETPSVAESRALLNAKRIALEEAGTYVESYAKVENFQLTKDEIQVLTSGLMEVEILDKKRTIIGDGFRFWVRIKARVNSDRIQEMSRKVKEKSAVEDYKKIQKAYEKNQREIEELRNQLAKVKGEKEKKQVEARITTEERLFQATEWFEKGKRYLISGKEYDRAILAYTSAIALNPNYADAYIHRGLTYIGSTTERKVFFLKADGAYKKDFSIIDSSVIFYNKAIEDYEKARSINPGDKSINYLIVSALEGIGGLYSLKGQYKIAIEYYNKAISIDPGNASPYVGRGAIYGSSGQLNMAIEDFNNAIILNPNFAGSAIYSRGNMYFDNGQVDKAISDWQKACDMGNALGCMTLEALQKR